MNSNDLVKKFILKWATSSSNPKFAVLLDGHWGSGKTYFVQDLLESAELSKKKCVYISLFGVSDISTIEAQLFFSTASGTAKVAHFGARFVERALQSTLRFDVSGDGSPDGQLNGKLSGAADFIQRKFSEVENAFLILDDLERSKIDVEELFGFVNVFVEHGNARVLFIANTEKLQELSKFEEIKEKVIGKQLSLEANTSAALSNFISEIEPQSVREELQRLEEQIQRLYAISRSTNLRQLRQFVWSFSELLSEVPQSQLGNQSFLESLVLEFFLIFFELGEHLSDQAKRAVYGFSETEGQDRSRFFVASELETVLGRVPATEVLSRYGANVRIESPLEEQTWRQIVATGSPDSDTLRRDISQLDFSERRKEWPSWKRLWHYLDWDFSVETETDFLDEVTRLIDELRRKEISDCREFLHACGVLLFLKSNKSIPEETIVTFPNFQNYVDEVLESRYDEDTYLSICVHRERGYDGLGYHASRTEDFKKVFDLISSRLVAWHERWETDTYPARVLSEITEDPNEFFRSLSADASANQVLVSTTTLTNINPGSFTDTWLELPRPAERSLISCAGERYRNHSSLVAKEVDWWRKVQLELRARASSAEGSPRAAQILRHADDIEGLIGTDGF
ncbi:P-loop NTPase fold protein [Sinisalibacter aestuarii]|uniref:KAP NTPase domain-containing protein n=1 Tax=Sinisalibacter aestuarii TaxID=2949426 RepID=A0ABQ5LT73_9RHOB|nr:P-loop NTPase fold protein [Sinisalibacter aestuarii]GKY88119.1 hypothetical protein STA1M1_19880 [Sinisalibacter aestuarii]